jgi:hypothetical protein
MALSDLRPDITVFQIFDTQAPIVPATNLPVGLIGLNRQFVWRGNAGTFVGGQPGQRYYFPNLSSGATVEQPGAVLDVTEFPDVLEPHVYVSNKYGVGEASAPDLSYDFVSDPPHFDLAPGTSVVFTIVEGDDGAYSAVTGYFTDSEEDFIEAEVATADVIEVLHSDGTYYPTFDVVNIISDSQLDVTRRNKAVTPVVPEASLGDEDAYGFRILTDANQQFEQNGVDVGDLCTIDGWDTIISILGGTYGAAGSGSGPPATSRVFTDPSGLFLASGVAAGDCLFSSDPLGDWVPFFYVSAPPIVDTQLDDVENIITVPTPNPPLTQTGSGVPYDIVRYGAAVDLTGAAVFFSPAGEYAAENTAAWALPAPGAGLRIFHDATANFLATPILIGQEIIINNGPPAPGPYYGIGNWPVFVVQAIPSPTDLIVSQHDSNVPLPASSVVAPAFAEYEVRPVSSVFANTAGSYLAEGTGAGGPTERRMTAAGIDFVAAGVVPGDWIQDVVTDTTLFTVVTVHPAGVGTLDVVNIISGTPPASSSNTRFAFNVLDQNAAILEVISVDSDYQLTVKNVLAGTPGSGTYDGIFINSVTFPDTGQDVNYRIKKTVTGSALEGDVLCTFTAKRNDLINQRVPIDENNFEAILGPPVPGNDLALAAQTLFTVLGASAYAIQVTDDTLADWTDGLKVAESEDIYIPIVLTQREDILALLRAHVVEMSEPEEKRERITYFSHEEVVQTTRTEESLGDVVTYNKTASGITTIVSTTRDLTDYGVIVGDVFTGTLNDGVTDYPITNARIISTQASTPASGQSTMRVVADPSVPAPSSGTVSSWIVKSKNLSLLERANQQAEYAQSIPNRRFRNIWPDTVQIRFTDETAGENATTGFFGGQDQTCTYGAHYLTVIEAGKRSNENPRQPLTGFKRGSVYKILDPMSDIQEYQDIIIDGGNYYIVHDGDDLEPWAIRALSTDVTDIYKAEDNVAAQVDSFARKLRTQLKPFLGPFVIDEPFFDLVSNNFEAVRKDVKEQNRELRDIVLLGIEEDPDRPDTFIIRCRVTPFISAAEGEVYIYI